MRFANVRVGGGAHLGLLDGDHVHLFAPLARLASRGNARDRRAAGPIPDDLLSFIEHGSMNAARAALALGRTLLKNGRARDMVVKATGVTFLAPIPRPRKNIVCLGRNYAEHAREWGTDAPKHPVFFTKAPTCVVGPDAPIIHHQVTQQLDYEVELAVIIGRRGRDIPVERALQHVFGYTVINDITARDLQRRHEQYFKGKSLDTFAPMGPVVAHRSVIRNPQALRLTTKVNGEVRQDSTTANMICTVAQLIAVLSAGMTLEPGDIMATGTPEGIGAARTPPVWLNPGDVVEAEVEGIGLLRNRVVAGARR